MVYFEKYISLEEYQNKYVDFGALYEGFVIGYGYVYVQTIAFQPPHLHGFSPLVGQLFGDSSCYIMGKSQIEDRSIQSIKLSLRGLFINGEAIIPVEQGMTLSQIATLFDVVVEDLVKWNDIKDPNKLNIGQKIKIRKEDNDGKPFIQIGKYAGVGGIVATIASLYDKPLIFGSKYIVINEGGTLVTNTNKTYTSTSKIAGKAGAFAYGVSVITDVGAVVAGEQTFGEAATSISINSIIYRVGMRHPATAIIIGIGTMMLKPNHPKISVPKRDNAIIEMDNTRVVRNYPLQY